MINNSDLFSERVHVWRSAIRAILLVNTRPICGLSTLYSTDYLYIANCFDIPYYMFLSLTMYSIATPLSEQIFSPTQKH